MESPATRVTRERVDSVVAAEDLSGGVSPVSPISFDHALQQLEEDLGLQESPSRCFNQDFTKQERPQGPYGPVANNLFISQPIWQTQQSPQSNRNRIRASVAAADLPPLTLAQHPAFRKASSRLSIDGSNIEFMSDRPQRMSRLGTNFRYNTASPTEHPTSPTGNMTGLQRSKCANFSRPAPQNLEKRRNSERSLSPNSDASPITPELPFHFLEPLRTSPQQLPRLVIPSRRKKSSAASSEADFQRPPPIPAYSVARPRPSGNRDSVAMSPQREESRAVQNNLPKVALNTHALPTIDLASMSPSGLPRIPEIQSAQESDGFDDSPTIPKSIQTLLDSPSRKKSSPVAETQRAAASPSPRMQKPKQDPAHLGPHEPYIVPSSPSEQDVFFTISDYYTADSPYDLEIKNNAINNSTFYYLSAKKDSLSLSRSRSPSPLASPFSAMSVISEEEGDDISLSSSSSSPSSDDEQQNQQQHDNNNNDTCCLRDYVQSILRRSKSQRKATSSWNKKHSGSSSGGSSSTSTSSSVNGSGGGGGSSSGSGSSDNECNHRYSASSVSSSIDDSIQIETTIITASTGPGNGTGEGKR